MDGFSGRGELEPEGSSFAGGGTDIHLAGVLLDDAVAHGKAQASSAPGGFRREEGIENAMQVFGGNADAGVGDFDFHGAILRHGADLEHAAIGHGVARIHEKIQENLLQPRGGAEDRRQIALEALHDVDARGLEGMLDQRESLFDDGIQIHFDEFGGAGAREIQKIVDDLGSAEGLLHDLVNGLLPRIVRGNLLGEHLDVIGDDRERRIHLVGHAGGEQAEGSELLGLHHLLFEAHALGDVVEQDEPAEARSGLAQERRNRDVDDQMMAAAAGEMEFVDAGNVLVGGARGDFRDEVRGEQLGESAAESLASRDIEQSLELRIPGFQAILAIHGEDADVERFDDVLAEVFETLDLRGLLLERLVEPGVFNGDGQVAGNGVEQFEVVARKEIAVHGLAQGEDGDDAVVEAAGEKIIQIETLDRAADRIIFADGRARGFKKRQPR